MDERCRVSEEELANDIQCAKDLELEILHAEGNRDELSGLAVMMFKTNRTIYEGKVFTHEMVFDRMAEEGMDDEMFAATHGNFRPFLELKMKCCRDLAALALGLEIIKAA